MKISRAVVRCIDDSLAKYALRHDASSSVDLYRARSQHEAYVSILRDRCGLQVTTLASNGFPDSVFIEDTAIIAGMTGLITRPGAKSRQNEVIEVAAQLRKHLPSVQGLGGPGVAFLDGGDVLFTADRFLVGQSKRTNAAGIVWMQKAFPSFPVIAVDVATLVAAANKIEHKKENETLLHLKSCCSMIGPHHIAVGGATGKVLANLLTNDFHHLKTAAQLSLNHTISVQFDEELLRLYGSFQNRSFFQPHQIIHLPDRDAANCLLINNIVIHRSSSEFPESAKVLKEFCERQGMERIEVEYDELAKVDGALTCCSLLF